MNIGKKSMQSLNNSISREKLVRLIESSDFLGEDLAAKWKERLDGIPEEFYGLIYSTFFEAKQKVDGLYRRIELARDENGEYRSLLNAKVTEIIKLVNRQKLNDLAA